MERMTGVAWAERLIQWSLPLYGECPPEPKHLQNMGLTSALAFQNSARITNLIALGWHRNVNVISPYVQGMHKGCTPDQHATSSVPPPR